MMGAGWCKVMPSVRALFGVGFIPISSTLFRFPDRRAPVRGAVWGRSDFLPVAGRLCTRSH
ncbi:hypothetical protein [Azospirillum doebereinerae]